MYCPTGSVMKPVEDYRGYFYDELYERVKNLSMADAVLEVNHWCHEKANLYRRIREPLHPNVNSYRSGRCGEESALLVTAYAV